MIRFVTVLWQKDGFDFHIHSDRFDRVLLATQSICWLLKRTSKPHDVITTCHRILKRTPAIECQTHMKILKPGVDPKFIDSPLRLVMVAYGW